MAGEISQNHWIGGFTGLKKTGVNKNGKDYVTFAIAISERRRNPETNQWEDGDVAYKNVFFSGPGAKAIQLSEPPKGSRLIVVGSEKPNVWTGSDGTQHRDFQIWADFVGPAYLFDEIDVKHEPRQGGSGRSGSASASRAASRPASRPASAPAASRPAKNNEVDPFGSDAGFAGFDDSGSTDAGSSGDDWDF